MPGADARDPFDPARPAMSDAVPEASVPEASAPGPERDLAAIPAFLRQRATAARAIVPRAASQPPSGQGADVASIPMLGIAPRRLVLVGAGILLAWLIVSFGRQVAEASAASLRAEELRSANAALAAEVAALEEELQVIQDQRYISQAARAFRLGNPNEIPFALEAGAPPLGPDAPGSAAVSLGAGTDERSPLDSWLEVLFGADD